MCSNIVYRRSFSSSSIFGAVNTVSGGSDSPRGSRYDAHGDPAEGENMRRTAFLAVLIAVCLLAPACGDDEPAANASSSTTRPPPPTSIPGVGTEGCSNWLTPVMVFAETDCDEMFETGRTVLAEFPEYEDALDGAIQLFLSLVCTCAQSDTPVTYRPDELHMPALADTVVGTMCPGNRDNTVPES